MALFRVFQKVQRFCKCTKQTLFMNPLHKVYISPLLIPKIEMKMIKVSISSWMFMGIYFCHRPPLPSRKCILCTLVNMLIFWTVPYSNTSLNIWIIAIHSQILVPLYACELVLPVNMVLWCKYIDTLRKVNIASVNRQQHWWLQWCF